MVSDLGNILQIMKSGLVFGVDMGHLEQEGDQPEMAWVPWSSLSSRVHPADGSGTPSRDVVMAETPPLSSRGPRWRRDHNRTLGGHVGDSDGSCPGIFLRRQGQSWAFRDVEDVSRWKEERVSGHWCGDRPLGSAGV